uniref:TonB-dependent receptor n=3 Tax=Caulobacter TaxID=75 RepID=UPI0025CDB6DC|nr:TonB-dependent siderophore receptor [uncultured Caulobacter sp.]
MSFSHRRTIRRATLFASTVWLLPLLAPGLAWADDAATEVSSVTVRGARGGYGVEQTRTATKTATALIDTPQAVSVVTRALIDDQAMQGMADVVRYMPGVGMAQGEGNRNAPIMRGVSSTANFFVDGVRDDVEYFRDLYNVERVEAMKGPNAMIFGRGGGGGILNRVTRQADGTQGGELVLQGGSWNNRRVTGDLRQPLTERFSLRATGVYENSDSYRDGVRLERYGVNPTARLVLSERTTLRLGYEYFTYDMVADRGIPSFLGRPVRTARSTFFGDPSGSPTGATIKVASGVIEHDFGGVSLRNVTSFGDYDKAYQNVYPGAVNAAGTAVSLSAYNNATQRENLFNQTDLTWSAATGRIGHKLLLGAEFGRQTTDNFRQTGYFTGVGPAVTTITVPLAAPTVSVPVTYRQSATDADNHGVAKIAAAYAQDQIQLTGRLQAIVGLRYDRFDVNFRNNRTGAVFATSDKLWSPRAGLVFKLVEPLALYASYSRSYLPRAGDQLSSLSLSNQALDPERFINREVGVKWDLRPDFSLTAAVYQLDRENVAATDPGDPTRLVLVKGQRSKGVELGAEGVVRPGWTLVGGYAYQDGEITQTQSATVRAGARLAQLPKHSASLWNRVDVAPRLALGLGVIYRSAIFASTDNTVTLPGFTRVDAALYYQVSDQVSAQLNVENVFDKGYYAAANSNSNITPGSPRAVRLSLRLSY